MPVRSVDHSNTVFICDHIHLIAHPHIFSTRPSNAYGAAPTQPCPSPPRAPISRTPRPDPSLPSPGANPDFTYHTPTPILVSPGTSPGRGANCVNRVRLRARTPTRDWPKPTQISRTPHPDPGLPSPGRSPEGAQTLLTEYACMPGHRPKTAQPRQKSRRGTHFVTALHTCQRVPARPFLNIGRIAAITLRQRKNATYKLHFPDSLSNFALG